MQHQYLNQDFTQQAEREIVPNVQAVRVLTTAFKRARDPTIQRNLDEILQQLQKAGPSVPVAGQAHSDKHCFTEAPGKKIPTSLAPRTKYDVRITQASIPEEGGKRSNTHSGVISVIQEVEAEFEAQEGLCQSERAFAGVVPAAMPGEVPASVATAPPKSLSFRLDKARSTGNLVT